VEPEIAMKLAIGAFVPGVAAAIAFFVLWRRTSDVRAHPAGSWIGEAFAAAPAIIAGFFAVLGGFSSAPKSSDQLMPYVAAGAIAASMLASAMRTSGARISIGFVFGALVLGVMTAMQTPMVGRWAAWEQGLLLFVTSFIGAATIVHAIGVVQQVNARLGAFTMMTLAAIAAQVIVLCFSSLKLGQLAGVIAALFGGMFVVTLVRPNARIMGSSIVSGFTVLVITMMQGVLYGEPALRHAVWPAMALPAGAIFASITAKVMHARPHGAVKWIAVIASAAGPGVVSLVLCRG
jgi:hypothetical protein